MANTSPFFLTGANAKIQVNGVTLAFVTDISYKISIPHISPKVLGMYESDSVEPLSYDVNGAFTMLRYARNAKSSTSAFVGSNANSLVSEDGNGIGNWGRTNLKAITSADGRAYESADPVMLRKASTFDIVIYQKLQNADNLVMAKIRNTRIVDIDFSLNKRSVAMQRFSFIANYVDEDSFLANYSGPLG